MGEIATWSAVKTKVGLGKDSNECPTKAELLALSPTGTGENYVGLEISNASSYGNNETVQLSDIHKVTYKYTFSQAISTLSFTALGGQSTNGGSIFNVISTKRKYLDGIATGSDIEVAYSSEDLPDWIIFQDNVFKALENTALSSRNYTRLSTQSESGKTLSESFTQAAATQSWEYTLSHGVWNETDDLHTAIAGEYRTYLMHERSYKQEKRNGKNYGPQIPVPVTVSSDSTWLTLNPTTFDDIKAETLIQTFQENKTLSRRYATITFTQAESGKKFTVKRYQAAGVKTYGNITITPTGDVPDIPASGGASHTFPYTWTQPWGWNGKTNDGGTLTTGGTETWNASVSGSNLGTTAKARTKLGVRTVTVTCNGKSGTATKDVYQAENKITNVTQGAWVVSISANPSTLTEMGGTSQISASARASRTNHWSSGATNAASDATGTPTLSIPTAVTGFSLSGTTLTVAENKTANQRSVVVRATMDTVYKEVTVTQSVYLVEWEYTFTASPTTLSFDALGTAKSITITSYREKYINGSLVDGSRENVSYIHATSTEHIGTVLGTSISMQENQTTSTRSGQVSYEQNGSNKVIRITCNQAAGTVSTRGVLEVVDNFGDSPAVGGSIFGLVKSGYYDVINGKDSTWHNVTPTLKSKSSYITDVEITKASGDGYNIGITLSENTSESSRRASLTLIYGSKEVDMATTQAGASVAWSYELKVNNGTQDLNQQVPAKPSGTYSFTISSKRYKIVNGSVTSQSEDTTWTTSIPGSPSWIHVEEQSNTLIVTVDENTTTSQRSADIVIFQTGRSDTLITLTVEQQAASITTRDYINYVEPIPDGMFSALAQSITVTLQSYRETLINGKVTSKVAVQPDFDLDSTVTDWASVDLIGGNPTNYEYDFKVSVKENTTNQTRSGSVMFYNGTAEVENGWAFTQDAATISTRYEISWTANYSNGTVEENVTEVELEGTTGMENSVRMDLHILEYTSINGVEGTPTSWDSRAIAENNSAIASPSGQVSATLQSDSENAFIGITNSVQNLAEYPRTHTITLYNPKVVINGKEGTVPTITLLVNPIPYTRIFEFSWKEGSTITNITLEGDIYGSSAGSRDIISYVSLRRNNVEFTKKYVKPTFIPPSEDWLQVIDNGQNSDNSYNWAFRALTNNEGDSARNQQVRFEQPGNGNQALYAYVSQDPMDEGYLGGRVNNNGPRTIRLNTVKDENWVGNTDIRSGNFYGLGTLAQDAITIEVNISVAGTDSSTYTQQVELSNLRFSESGRPVTISNDPNQNTDYEYSWKLYPNANVPASFTVNISMLSSDGDNDDGIHLDIIKKNTAVFPIGTLIGDLTLTPKDPTKLPILLCAVYHRYFT
nr:MAG: hypothetical protein [Bacteriophage sp.]